MTDPGQSTLLFATTAGAKAGVGYPAIGRAEWRVLPLAYRLRLWLAERVPPYRASRRPITEGLRAL